MFNSKYDQILINCMERRAWGWNYFNFVHAQRPLLVSASDNFLVWPGVVGEDLNTLKEEALKAWFYDDSDHPELENLYLWLDGSPTEDQFVQAWHWSYKQRHIGLVGWCDISTDIRWKAQIGSLLEEHLPGGIQQAFSMCFGEVMGTDE